MIILVEFIELSHVGGCNLKIKNVDVLFDMFWFCAFGNHDKTVLQIPANKNLCG